MFQVMFGLKIFSMDSEKPRYGCIQWDISRLKDEQYSSSLQRLV